MAKKQNFHENFTEHDEIKGPSNKNFGFTVGGVFGALALIKTIIIGHVSVIAMFFIAICVWLVGGAAVKPDSLAPLNKGWMKLAMILFHIVNPVVMFLMYVVCFIPGGLIMRIVGYDPMHRKFDKDAKTYWIEKKETDLPDPMKYQF